MAEASVTFAVGSEQATVVLPVDLPAGETIITGDFGGLVAAGTVARLRGSVRLIDNMHVRGTLLCDPTGVDLDGQNLFDIHTHDGTLNLVGQEKTAWCNWGDTPVGWQVGDRLGVAPTKVGVYVSAETTWQGSWAATTRPANSPDVLLVDGTVARPEVANLSQTVTLRNLKRIMVHEASAPNPQTFKWIRVLNSGEASVLTMYPIHFHFLYDHSRGSLIEGVVVEGGKNHAFVPHGSHGVTLKDCVAYKTLGNAYWWDMPPASDDYSNDSDDAVWDHCLAIHVTPEGVGNSRAAAFFLGSGLNLACVNSVAACVQGNLTASESNRQRSGFHWPEGASRTSWLFKDCVGHNNVDSGITIWQNARAMVNLLEDFTAYRNGFEGINHGSYTNRYHYRGAKLTGNGFRQHAKSPHEGPMVVEDILSDSPLTVTKHNSSFMFPTYFRNCTFPQVVYVEGSAVGTNGTINVFEDCGLAPGDFNLAGIAPMSTIDILEGGVLTHRWAAGVWS